jgi:hypothetical protein
MVGERHGAWDLIAINPRCTPRIEMWIGSGGFRVSSNERNLQSSTTGIHKHVHCSYQSYG